MIRYKRKPRRARIQMALPGEKKRRWMDFAEENDMTLTELIETSVDARIVSELKSRDTDIEF